MFDKEISLSKNLFGLCKDPKCLSFVVSDLPMLCWGFWVVYSLWDRNYQRVGTKLFDLLPFLAILSLKSLSNKSVWATEYGKTKFSSRCWNLSQIQDLSRISEPLFDSLGSLYSKQIQRTLPFGFQHCSHMWHWCLHCENWFLPCQGTWINCPKLFRSAISDPAGSRNCLWATLKKRHQDCMSSLFFLKLIKKGA